MDLERQWRNLQSMVARPWIENQEKSTLDIFGRVHSAENQVFQVQSATILKAKIELLDPMEWQLHAHLIRAYVSCASEWVNVHHGEVISFDGYHFTALFSDKLNNAVEAALRISRALEDLIEPAFEALKPDLKLKLRHTVGVARGSIQVVTTSNNVRTMSSIVGQPIAFAEILLHLYEPGIWITSDIFENLAPNTKLSEQGYMWKREHLKGSGSRNISRSIWRKFSW